MFFKLIQGLSLRELSTHIQQKNQRYTFSVGLGSSDGKIYFTTCDTPQPWRLLGGTGTPILKEHTYDALKAERIISTENSLFVLMTNGELWRINNLDGSAEQFTWKRKLGAPFDNGPGMNIDMSRLIELAASSASKSTTQYYVDPSGNKIERFITHGYVIYKDDPYIHHFDPWTPADLQDKLPVPIDENNNFILPAIKYIPRMQRSIDAAGGVVALINEKGVYTIEYDFDINGANPLVYYQPFYKKALSGISKLFFNRFTPMDIPAKGWKKQCPIPGDYTGNIMIDVERDAQGRIIPGSTSRIMRVPGRQVLDATVQYGVWQKELLAESWDFIPDTSLNASYIAQFLISADTPRLQAIPQQRYMAVLDTMTVSLNGFGAYLNMFSGNAATLDIRMGQKNFVFDLYTHLQFRLTTKVPKDKPFGGYVEIPQAFQDDQSAEAKKLRQHLGVKNKSFSWLFVKMTDDGVLIRKGFPFFRKVALFNWINSLFGKKLFYLTKA